MKQLYRPYLSLPEPIHPRTWASVDLRALRHNYRLLCHVIECAERKIRPIAVVKADAYGHGAPACVRALLEEGCDYFAVSCIEEAIAVRRACGSRPAEILILGYTDPADAERLARENLIQTLLSASYAETLANAATRANVRVRSQIALDTGMNRLGLPAQSEDGIKATAESIFRIRKCKNLQIEGIFSHFARADEGEDGICVTDEQTRRFRAVCERLEEQGCYFPLRHICNSAAAITRPTDRMDGVRLGIALYGVCPSEQISLPLRPVMRLCTTVIHIHRVSEGAEIGYGGAWKADGDRLIATLPIGYADGWLRAYHGAEVRVETAEGARSVPIVGRICMDQCMVDVTNTAARVGDTVILFGDDPHTLPALAGRAGSIEYESLCLISSRVPRVYSERLKGK